MTKVSSILKINTDRKIGSLGHGKYVVDSHDARDKSFQS